MDKIVSGVGRALVPPGIHPDLWWRLVVSGLLAFLLAAFLWSVGAFAMLGFSGFARADRLADMEAKQDVGLRITLSQEICRLYWLRMDSTGAALEQFNNSYERRQEEYATVNRGRRYDTRECSRPQ